MLLLLLLLFLLSFFSISRELRFALSRVFSTPFPSHAHSPPSAIFVRWRRQYARSVLRWEVVRSEHDGPARRYLVSAQSPILSDRDYLQKWPRRFSLHSIFSCCLGLIMCGHGRMARHPLKHPVCDNASASGCALSVHTCVVQMRLRRLEVTVRM